MEQYLSGGRTEEPADPNRTGADTISDSHTKGGILAEGDELILSSTHVDIPKTRTTDGARNGYSLELQRSWGKMFGKDAWRS